MRYYKLSNGVELPAIAFGTWLATTEKGEQNIVDALWNGYRYIDTAAFYKNEEEIGRAIIKSGVPREELTIASKVWRTMLGYEKTIQSFNESLERLQMDYLDVFLIHWPRENMTSADWAEQLQGSWAAMEELHTAGKIRAIGLSNFLPHHIDAIMKTAVISPVINQLELHAGYMQPTAVEYCKRYKILPQAWSPLGRGRIFEEPIIKDMAVKYGVSVSNFLLTYLDQQDIALVVKSSSPERMQENLNVGNFRIEDEDISILNCMPQMGWSGEHPDFIK